MLKKLTKKINLFILLVAVDFLLICGDEIVYVVSKEPSYINEDSSVELSEKTETIPETEAADDSDVGNDVIADSTPAVSTKPKNIAVMNSDVIMFEDFDEALINESIKSVEETDDGILIDIAAGTALDSVQNETVFYLGGNETSWLGRGYFGKITSKTEYSDYITYVINTPDFDEVFDILRIDFEESVTADNISRVVALDGVNVTATDSMSSYFPEHSGDSDTGVLIDFNVDLLEVLPIETDIANSGLEISGKIGLEDINVDVTVDYDVLHGNGMESLSVNTDGNLYEDVNVNSLIKIESDENGDRLFPIAEITFDSMISPHYYSNENIRTLSGSIPITVEMVIYVDIQGNVTQSMNAHFSLSQNFDCDYNVVENSEWLWDVSQDESTVQNVDFKTEMSGKSDSYLATAMSFCVFNLDLLDFEVAKLGAESEGILKIDYFTDKSDSVKSTVNATHELRVYLKKYDLKVNINEDISVENNGEEVSVNKEYPASDITIREFSGTYTPPPSPPQEYVPPVTQTTSYAEIKLSVPDFKQYDSRWGNIYIGNKTIKAVGCLVTSMSMKYSYHTGTTVYPDAMLGKLTFSNNLLYWSSVSALGYYYTQQYKCGITNSIMNTIYQKLKLGRPVIIGGTNNSGGMHWVVITGYNGNSLGVLSPSDFIINDPGGTRTNLAQFLAVYPKVERLVY